MAWIQLSLLGLLAVSFLVVAFSDDTSQRRATYLGLVTACALLLVAALARNTAGRFTTSALLTVATAIAVPWSTLVLDPAVAAGDLMPLSFVVCSVILSAMLLGTKVTLAVAAGQWLLLLALARFSAMSSFNWVALLTLVFFVSVICLLGNLVIQRDLKQIHRQARHLAAREMELHDLSIRDPLTDLFNRRYMQEALASEIERARRSGLPTSVMIIDVDHFKLLNDAYGHAAGDGVLRQLGSLLTGHFRTSDVVCRYGGDEFVVILPETPLRVAVARAERLGTRVSDHLVVGGGGRRRVTLSIGVAAFPKYGSTFRDLIAAADTGLYRAKADGRNCVRQADPVIDLAQVQS